MHLIFLSPHLDDAAYSSGGIIWQKARQGDDIEIWTICAGDPPGELTPFAQELHQRWGSVDEAVRRRREEDTLACSILGVRFRHLHYSDCIYRRIPGTGEPVIHVNEDLFQPVKPGEIPLVQEIAAELQALNQQNALMFCPLGIGGHVDHRLTRMAAEKTGLPLAYYADFPYAATKKYDLREMLPDGSQPVSFVLTEESLVKWTTAVAAYGSQLSSFWASNVEMSRAIWEYSSSLPGSTIWCSIACSQIQ